VRILLPLQQPEAIRACVAELAARGATAIPLLADRDRRELAALAARYPYRAQPETVGSGERRVRQQLAACEVSLAGTPFAQLRDALQAQLRQALAQLDPPPLSQPLAFNALALQKYPASSLGITPHRDGKRYLNLVCIVVLSGWGRFLTCADRAGTGATEIDATPGNAILMRAPGFHGATDGRPFHTVADIRSPRYVLALRQNSRCERESH